MVERDFIKSAGYVAFLYFPFLIYSTNMRTCLRFILAIMLSLNAAYAASVGVCDALEHTSSQAAHFGHHSHEDSDDHVHDGVADAGEAGNATMLDHHHAHVHPSFSYLLPDTIGVMPLEGCSFLVTDPASIFVSAPQALLDRPPRAALA